MSKQPVMEALRRLSGDGLVEILPQVGSRVATYALREVSDFFLMFGGFEGTIAGIAALRRTETQLDEMELISARIAALRPSPDAVERAHGYRVLNRGLPPRHPRHGALPHHGRHQPADVGPVGLPDQHRGVPQPLSSALDERHADHERIRAALHAGDQDAARAEMERHIVGTVAVIHAESKSMGETGTGPA